MTSKGSTVNMNTCPGLTIVTSPSSLGSDTYTKEEDEEEEERSTIQRSEQAYRKYTNG